MDKVIWKGVKSFRRKDGFGRVTLEAEVKEHLGIDYKNPKAGRKLMKSLSISGTVEGRRGSRGRFGIESCGQVLDDLNPNEYENGQTLRRIIMIWKKYHLNDLTAGTIKQEQLLKKFTSRPVGWSYTDDVDYLKSKNALVDKGYTYGHSWLTKTIPSSIITEIKRLFR